VLTGYDVHLLCGVVKEFLRSLDEPLVTRVLWREFVKASELSDPEARKAHIWQTIGELPQANQDTLAYMMMHLQRIAASPACKMPKTNLARVFGPTIINHSMADIQPIEMLGENRKQIATMEVLLDIPSDQWESIVRQNENIYGGNDVVDPAIRRSSYGTRGLGGKLMTNGMMTPRRQNTIYNPQKGTPNFLKPLF